jgi:hypothetical protein
MNNVIRLFDSKPAKAQGVSLAAFFAAERLGLTITQCKAAARRARDLYVCGRGSPARIVANVRRESYELSTAGAA